MNNPRVLLNDPDNMTRVINVEFDPYYELAGRHLRYKFPFESSFDYFHHQRVMNQYWSTGYYWCAAYVLIVFGLKQWMKDRKAFELRRQLQLWNILLAIFSILGTIRVWPEMFHTYRYFGFEQTVCRGYDPRHDNDFGFWVWAFTLSKAAELVDTVFIVLRKHKLIFLHWYHHVTVLLFTWYSFPQLISTARW